MIGGQQPTGSANKLFAALADPTRRSIVELLVARGPSTATGLAGELTISRQATAKHLAQLLASGLADSRRIGRETRYTLNPEPLGAVAGWVTAVERDWSKRLDLLKASLKDEIDT